MKKILYIGLAAFLQVTILYSQSGQKNHSIQQNPNQVNPAVVSENHKNDLKIRFSFTNDISKTPISGRIIVGFHDNLSMPINNPDLMDPQPTFAWDVNNWNPGEAITLDGSTATSWMGNLDSLNGWYGVQAILKTNKTTRSLGARGNGVSAKNIVFIEKGKMCRPLDLLFNIPAKERKFEEQEFVKAVTIKSGLMTDFYGEPEFIQAAVILPRSYFKDSSRIYPSVYVFGGWGSTHYDALTSFQQERYGMNGIGEEKVFIFVNHECRTGYHVFCSSETNGPREETFFQELVPFIEKEYRVNKNPRTRFLMGQSSGAWAALWLLINYPDQLGSVYVASPDPVDFTEFIGTNIYEKNANMYFNSNGEKKYMVENLSVEDFTGLDRIAGWGEQMYSFDATFSKRNGDGRPQRLYNWDTGMVNPEVAAFWEKHDLSKVVSGLDWQKIKPLNGKIHIYVAKNDSFGLNKPVYKFQEILLKKNIDAEIKFPTSGGHNVWTDELRKLIHSDMDSRILENGIFK